MRGASRLRVAFVATAVVTVLLAGVLLAGIGSSDTDRTDDDPAAPAVPSAVGVVAAGPMTEREGLPAGFTQDQAGAVAAAVAYATAPQRWLYFSDDQLVAAIHAIATPQADGPLADETLAEVRAARSQLGASPGRVWWLVRPMAWRLESFGVERASVAVWTVTILSAEEVAIPQSEWVTVTIDLEWVGGDWRVGGVRDTAGPTPVQGPGDQPWDAGPFDEALAGFTRMDGEPVT
jgi:hypothetical protein